MAGSILIKNMTFQYTSQLEPIFEHVNVNIHENWKLGLVGRNGRGKTTFLKILLDQLAFEGAIQSNLEFKYFPSIPSMQEDLTALELLWKNHQDMEVWEMERELAYMDLSSEVLQMKFHQLSGGEQTKLLLIELFLNKNVFPLIDEPANNLDAHGRQVVGNYLKRKKGFIVISHDEFFLNQFVDHILAINKKSIDLISGNMDTWKHEKAKADKLSQETNTKLKNEINRLKDVSRQVNTWGNKRENSTKDASERRLAAKQMKRAKAIMKRTDEMIAEKEGLIHNIEDVSGLKMTVGQPRKQILLLRNFSILRDGKPLFEPVNADIYPGDRCFIQGKNGAGKSTLLDFMLGDEQLETIGEYETKLPERVSVLKQKNQTNTGYASLLQQFDAKEKETFWHLLHQLGMQRTAFANHSSKNWSAGEQKKIFLAKALIGRNDLFIWDEVTNYLDIMVIDQLIDAINKYQPTMIGVDHNEYFVHAVATKKVVLKPFQPC